MKDINTIDEKELLLRLNNGDASAFHQLYDHHKAPLASKILSLLKSDELVQDIMQDLFLKLWEIRSRVDANRPIAPLLYSMARNKVIDIFRKANRDIQLRSYLSSNTLPSDSADAKIINKEDMVILKQALDALPARQREVFTLHKLEGKSYKEISEMLSISTSAINQHIYRANRALNENLSLKKKDSQK